MSGFQAVRDSQTGSTAPESTGESFDMVQAIQSYNNQILGIQQQINNIMGDVDNLSDAEYNHRKAITYPHRQQINRLIQQRNTLAGDPYPNL